MKNRDQKKRLRSGFTTGCAAAAAAKAAVLALLDTHTPSVVDISLLTGDSLKIAVHKCSITNASTAAATVIKDAGDDPDVTNRAEIGARVRLRQNTRDLIITGGHGVGTVTRPGLEISPGNAAINPGPVKMITQSVKQALDSFSDLRGAEIKIFVPRGEEIAARTLNARLGITGGISILGTTGVVKPMSHEAYIATIASGMSVAAACKTGSVICTTGRRSERYSQALFPEKAERAFVQIGDYFEKSMKLAVKNGFSSVVLAVFFGKAVKIAQGAPHTHAARSRMGLDKLSSWVLACCGDNRLAQEVADSNTARQAFFIIRENCPEVFKDIAERMICAAQNFAGCPIEVRSVIFDYQGGVAADISNAETC
ncbi:MAG: cobalt-precorrin-5B (C(1))-methyltransferase CbiD [Desulfobacterales bacterium]